jgi:putative ABC transport system ATP-binding protein
LSLLVMDGVTQRHRHGRIERGVLDDVSLEVQAGELVAVWGPRRSGRSTLLRVAAGIELAHDGRVVFDGHDLARCRDRVLGRGIGYVKLNFSPLEGGSVLEQVGNGLFAERMSAGMVRRAAQEALVRVGAESCAELAPSDLDAGEVVRVAIARALVGSPKLLVADEPASGVDLQQRDSILRLLRVVANSGVAVLTATGDGAALAGVDHALSLDRGSLYASSSAEQAPVIQLRRSPPSASTGSGHAG